MEKEAILISIFVLACLLFLHSYLSTKEVKVEFVPSVKEALPSKGNVVRMKIPAVDNEGNGVMTTLVVEAVEGKGRVLTDINHLLFFIDTQNSIQIAKNVAERITGINTSKIDLIYQIETNASVIGGPSAGAALTIATIAALQNKSLNEKVSITGTINLDGTIGVVGGIEEKARAVKEEGMEIFLVPKGQGVQITYTPKRECRKIGPILYCTTEYLPKKVDVSESVGITVKEVSNVEEALKYFMG
ncbi:MAG: S16 family serine protease [Candidatus Aenigmatarchaeota archaeon]